MPYAELKTALSHLTPPITRRPSSLLLMTSSVSAVGCIGLFGCAVEALCIYRHL